MQSSVNKNIVVGIGEILWDIFPEGKRLGGAPSNFAFHINELGLTGIPVSAVGDDSLGMELINRLENQNVSCEYLQVLEGRKTGTVVVTLNKQGVPGFVINTDVAWDAISFNEKLDELAGKTSAVCFGSLAQRCESSRNTIKKFLSRTGEKCIKVFDINLRQNFYSMDIIESSLHLANVLKLNKDELVILSKFFDLAGDDCERCGQLLSNYNLNIIALTNGEIGSTIFTKTETSILKPKIVNVIDTVGAGDSFTAGLMFGLVNDVPLHKSHEIANELASFVCTQKGAMPKHPGHIKNFMMNQ